MKEKKAGLPAFLQKKKKKNPGLNFSFISRCTAVDQRQAPRTSPAKCSPAWLSSLTAGCHLPVGDKKNRWLVSHFAVDGHSECMTFGSILMGIPDTRRLFCGGLGKAAAALHPVALRSAFASLQPGLAWSSVGSHLTKPAPQPRMCLTLQASWWNGHCQHAENFVWPSAGDRDPAGHMCTNRAPAQCGRRWCRTLSREIAHSGNYSVCCFANCKSDNQRHLKDCLQL